MEATREIFWNVGDGTETLVPMYFGTLVALALLAWGFLLRYPTWRSGRPLNRLDQLGRRLTTFLVLAFAQVRVMNVRKHGVTHALFFWGFGLLFIGTALIFLQADFTEPLAGVRFLRGSFYLGYSLVLDLAGIAGIGALLYFFVRRFLVRPPSLPTRWDDVLSHVLLFPILLTGFVLEGARMAVTEVEQNPDLARWSPIGLGVANLLGGLSEQGLRNLHEGVWWFHLLLTLSFVASIPFTKLRHMFTTAANYLFVPLEPKGYLPTLDLEAEDMEEYGVERVADLSWKDVYDADACMSCKRCQDRCPAWATDKPLNPMRLVHQVGEVAFSRPADSLIETVTPEVLWECTTCRACQHICPATIEHVNKILEMRRRLVLMQGEFPGDEVRLAIENYEVNSNPFGTSYVSRGDWAAGLPVVDLSEHPGESIDVLYFVGCYASFDRRNQSVARSLVELLSAAGLRVGILGKEEKCCGDPPRKLGNEYLYQMMARENIAAMEATGAPLVVATCPHGYNMLGRDYRDLGFTLPVEHYTTLVLRLLREGKLPLQADALECTYHDSCYLSRYMDILDEPRELLVAAGARLSEIRNRGNETFCCGGGGGLILSEERVGRRINVTRVDMALETEAPVFVSSCPFCLTNFEDGIKVADAEDRLLARDLAEVLAERLAGRPQAAPVAGQAGGGPAADAAASATEGDAAASASSGPSEREDA